MAIEKHTTDAVIIDTYDVGENDTLVKLFTHSYGLIFAMAKSARKLESKLKLHIKKGKYASVTVVKGREMYRLTGIVEEDNDIKIYSSAIIAEVLDRFIKAEGRHSQLYNKLHSLAALNIESKVLRLVSYIITLIDLGYADAEMLGCKNIDEYKSMSLYEMCLICTNNQDKIRRYVKEVISNTML
jgi:DNA repair protein RecO